MAIKPVRTTEDLQDAKAELAKLLRLPSAPNRDDNIAVLVTLIEQFEEKHFPVNVSDPIAAIKYRMEESGFTPRDLEPYIGSRARVSEVLSGKRQLSIDMIRSLHEGLSIPYEALISERRQPLDGNSVSQPVVARMNSLGFTLDQEKVPAFISSLDAKQQSSCIITENANTARSTKNRSKRVVALASGRRSKKN
ncbi:antitoxin component HigA of HigAB toxin-antitoxin module [Bradyrhizobium sp. LM3.4]